jgi:RNA polymerase sigma-70 factor (ECF subfamily)
MPAVRAPKKSRWLDDPEVVLMLRVKNDDSAAFAELVSRHWSQLFGRFYHLFNDRQEAEDLAQDVLLRVYRHRKRYHPRARFATWLYHITQNVARNAIRSRRRHPRARQECYQDVAGDGRLAHLIGATFESPSGPLERAELISVVRSAVAGLAQRQRTALELHQFQDRTYTEVAEEMHMTPKAAKSLLYRARNVLRGTLTAFVQGG